MFKLDKLISFIVLASLVGAVAAPIVGIIARPGPGATQFMLGLVAMAGFLIALVLALGVVANISQARANNSDEN